MAMQNEAVCQPPDKQLQRTATRHRGDDAIAPFHFAPHATLAPSRVRAAHAQQRWTANDVAKSLG